MEDMSQIDAYINGGSSNSTLTAAYIFHIARTSQVIKKCNRIVDLGCGSAIQLTNLAKLHPRKQFLGVDYSSVVCCDLDQF